LPAELLNKLFVNRTDCHCIQLATGGYARINKPITLDLLNRHLRGEVTVGSYQLDTENRVKWFCFDLDPEKLVSPKTTAQKILQVTRTETTGENGKKTQRIPDHALVLEASRYPDDSYHIWVLFQTPVKAVVARWLAYRILELAKLDPKKIEVYPKQNETTPDRPYGNFVKLPFGKHQVEQKFSQLLNLSTFTPEPLTQLKDKHGLIIDEQDAKIIEQTQAKQAKQNVTLKTASCNRKASPADIERTIQVLMKYWINGYRNDLALSFCGLCIKKGYSLDTVKHVISEVCDRTDTTPTDKTVALQKIEYQYLNRRNINLKGASGLYEVFQTINSKHGKLTEKSEVNLLC
jgi:hypothetical protein